MFKSVPIQFTVHLFTDQQIALKFTIHWGKQFNALLRYASIGFKTEQFLTTAAWNIGGKITDINLANWSDISIEKIICN